MPKIPNGPSCLFAHNRLKSAGQDVPAVQSMLLADHKIVTTAALPLRAPREMTEPYLRISPHVDCTKEDLESLAAALPAS